jgi:hypothetical protein
MFDAVRNLAREGVGQGSEPVTSLTLDGAPGGPTSAA